MCDIVSLQITILKWILYEFCDIYIEIWARRYIYCLAIYISYLIFFAVWNHLYLSLDIVSFASTWCCLNVKNVGICFINKGLIHFHNKHLINLLYLIQALRKTWITRTGENWMICNRAEYVTGSKICEKERWLLSINNICLYL